MKSHLFVGIFGIVCLILIGISAMNQTGVITSQEYLDNPGDYDARIYGVITDVHYSNGNGILYLDYELPLTYDYGDLPGLIDEINKTVILTVEDNVIIDYEVI